MKESIIASPVIDKNGYPYIIHPVTDGVPLMDPEMLREIIRWMLNTCDFDCDVILAPESMGIPLAVPLSLETNIPYSIIRKRQYGLPEEISVSSSTGYSNSAFFINGLKKEDKVVIVDDVLSTGGTLSNIVKILKDSGIIITDVLVAFDKSINGVKDLGIEVKTMLKIGIKDGRPFCEDPNENI